MNEFLELIQILSAAKIQLYFISPNIPSSIYGTHKNKLSLGHAVTPAKNKKSRAIFADGTARVQTILNEYLLTKVERSFRFYIDH